MPVCLASGALGQVAPVPVIDFGHATAVVGIATSANGSFLADISKDGRVIVRDLRSGLVESSFTSKVKMPQGLVFHPKLDELVVYGAIGGLEVWNFRGAKLEFERQPDLRLTFSCAAFRPDGKEMALGQFDNAFTVANHQTWITLLDFPDRIPVRIRTIANAHKGDVGSLAYDPSSQHLASTGEDGAVRLWDTVGGKMLAESVPAQVSKPNLSGIRVDFGQGARFVGSDLFVAVSNRLRRLDPSSLAERDSKVLPPLFGAVSLGDTCAAIPVQSDGSQNWVSFVGLGKKDATVNLSLNFQPTALACLDQADAFAVGMSNGDVRIVGSTGSDIKRFNPANPVMGLAFVRGSRILISGNSDGSVRLWDYGIGRLTRNTIAHTQGLSSLAVDLAGDAVVTGGEDGNQAHGQTKVWSFPDLKLLETLPEEESTALVIRPRGNRVVTISPNGKIVATGESNSLSVYERDSKRKKVLESHGFVTSLSFSPDGGALAVGYAQTAVEQQQKHPNGALAVNSAGSVDLYDSHTWQLLRNLPIILPGPQYSVTVTGFNFSPDGNVLGICAEGGLTSWDWRNGKQLEGRDKPSVFSTEGATHAWILPDNGFAFCGESGFVQSTIISAPDSLEPNAPTHPFQMPKRLESLSGAGTAITATADGGFLAGGGEDGITTLWNAAGQELLRLVPMRGDDFFASIPSGYYSSSPHAGAGVAFRVDGSIYPFEQFDLIYNRPDLVASATGISSRAEVDAYTAAHQMRLARMGVAATVAPNRLELPEVSLHPNFEGLSTDHSTVVLSISGRDSAGGGGLRRLNLYANDVPVFGSKGIEISGASINRELTIPLIEGRNRLQVSIQNSEGFESPKATLEIQCTTPEVPDLYVIAVGVSKYQSGDNLQYAAKDASDLIASFQALVGKPYAHVRVYSGKAVTDAGATRAVILAAKGFLLQSKPCDRVIVSFAGHGLVDRKDPAFPYYFGTSDISFDNPKLRGLSYSDMEGILDGIPARDKVLLIDTCHSGELEPAETKPDPNLAQRHVVATGARANPNADPGLVPVAAADLLPQLFGDLSIGSGACVIAASGGLEYAYEQRGNGVFTSAVLEALKSRHLTVSALRDYVLQRVSEETDGRQKPDVRQESVEFDFSIE